MKTGFFKDFTVFVMRVFKALFYFIRGGGGSSSYNGFLMDF